MDKVLIRMPADGIIARTADEICSPEIIFVGNQDTAEAKLFRIITNAENGSYKRVADEIGIHIIVNETQMELQGRKSVPVIKEEHYFLQNAKRD
jgi:hypothetical protein